VYRQAQERVKEGNWAGYGQAMERLEEVLRQMADEGTEAGGK